MIVHFEMSGGYGGLFVTDPLRLRLDTESLADDEAAEIERMVAESGLATADRERAPDRPSPVPDVFEYRIQIVSGGDTYAHVLDDTTVPPEARPLIDHLRTTAMDRRAGEA